MTYGLTEPTDAYRRTNVPKKLAATAQTNSKEVIHDQPECVLGNHNSDRVLPYSQFSRIIDVCCMAEMLRNFNITSLRDDEIERYLELQSFFFGLEDRCLSEAGIE